MTNAQADAKAKKLQKALVETQRLVIELANAEKVDVRYKPYVTKALNALQKAQELGNLVATGVFVKTGK
jgi:hypothetical protein